MRFIELFAGIGGFRYGLEQNGFKCVWANEIDKHACQIYRKNFGKEELYEGDIRQIKADDIPNHELLVGGFPCQSFSIAGKRGGFEDTRGTLFFEIARILSVKRPPLLLLENVKGLLSHDNGNTFGTILTTLSDLGYFLQWQVLNSKDFGVPQNRERVFIVGHLRRKGIKQVFPIGKTIREFDSGEKSPEQISNTLRTNYPHAHSNETYVGEIEVIGGLQKHQTPRKDGISPCLPEAMGKGGGHTPIIMPDRKYNQKSVNETLRKNKDKLKSGEVKALDLYNQNVREESPTLTDPKHDSIAIYDKDAKIRRLTPTECERLQGFPDGWTKGVSDSQRYKCLGNAVTTNVITAIGERL